MWVFLHHLPHSPKKKELLKEQDNQVKIFLKFIILFWNIAVHVCFQIWKIVEKEKAEMVIVINWFWNIFL